MSYFAQIKNNIVQQVIVAEQDYIDTLHDKYDWIQTSYNTRGGIHYGQDGKPDGGIALRANYACIGDIYDVVNDVFYKRKPYPSWIISAPSWTWEAPTPYPDDGNAYYWDETTRTWILVPS